MNRYDITNLHAGRTFSLQGTVFPPVGGYQPEWGGLARTKRKDACDAFELSRATNERPDPNYVPSPVNPQPAPLIVDLPDDFVVVTTNIDADISDEAAKKLVAQTALQAIKDFDETTVADATIRSWMRNVKRVLNYVYKSI